MLPLVTSLLAATADAHSPRALIRAIATTLATHFPITRIHTSFAYAELVDLDWRYVDAKPCPIELAPGLAVAMRGTVPSLDADARAALAQVIATAARHLEVVQRVAALSRTAHAANRTLRASLDRRDTIIARSPAMRDALARAELVARHPTSVLLLGESGSGKEVLAREVHRLSPRAQRSFIHVNCGALPDSLVEAELFGHERGAFTGADRTHVGAFERAHRGTLFLDEIGELPLAAQTKLLRVLQDHQIRRVGGETDLDVDVRVIAATNRSFQAMVERGTFREDLYYRLDVFAIRVPPLRERRADIAPLVEHIVAELARKLDIEPPPITRDVLARLEAHAWPGNVRELVNVLESALIIGKFPDLAPRPRATVFESAVRDSIETALRATRGKIYGRGGAAELLGLKPGTLQSKMRKLGIARDRFS